MNKPFKRYNWIIEVDFQNYEVEHNHSREFYPQLLIYSYSKQTHLMARMSPFAVVLK